MTIPHPLERAAGIGRGLQQGQGHGTRYTAQMKQPPSFLKEAIAARICINIAWGEGY